MRGMTLNWTITLVLVGLLGGCQFDALTQEEAKESLDESSVDESSIDESSVAEFPVAPVPAAPVKAASVKVASVPAAQVVGAGVLGAGVADIDVPGSRQRSRGHLVLVGAA